MHPLRQRSSLFLFAWVKRLWMWMRPTRAVFYFPGRAVSPAPVGEFKEEEYDVAKRDY